MNIHVSVVVRDGHEIEWFETEKNAAAFVQHVYGLTPYGLIENRSVEIKSLDGRGPKPGDAVVTSEGDGVLSGDCCVTLNARAFRAGEQVSCSGGPCRFVKPDRLRFVGLKRLRVWRWADGYPAAHNDGEYCVTVPVWEEAKP